MKKRTYMTCFWLFVSVVFSSCAVNGMSFGGGNGGGSNPSAPGPLYGVFVATNGSDTNSGTNLAFPLRTFGAAISNALINNLTNIYVAEGTYKPGSGLNGATRGLVITNSGLHFSGGWDSNFSSITGYSVLDGNFSLDHVVYVKNVSNMTFQGMIVRNGYAIGNDAANTNGAGMYMTNIHACLFTNLIVCSNYSLADGGGIWFCGNSNVFSADILSNYANYSGIYYGFGGGIFTGLGSYHNTFSGEFSYNTALGGGGIFLGTNTGNNRITCVLQHNIAYALCDGAGIALYYSQANSDKGMIHSNVTVYAAGPPCFAGGVFVTNGSFNKIEGSICSNIGYYGAGACFTGGSNNTLSAFVYDNIQAGYGGGLMLYRTQNATVSGLFLRNQGIWCCSGIGLSIDYSSALLTNLIVTANSCGGSGGGCYQYGSTVSTNDLYIYNNSPDDWVY